MNIKPNLNRQGNKRITLLFVLKALEQMSDTLNPIKQITLAKMVNDIGNALNLDIWCDRKTIGRHLKILTAAGYKIVVVKGKGCYLESSKLTQVVYEAMCERVSMSRKNMCMKDRQWAEKLDKDYNDRKDK